MSKSKTVKKKPGSFNPDVIIIPILIVISFATGIWAYNKNPMMFTGYKPGQCYEHWAMPHVYAKITTIKKTEHGVDVEYFVADGFGEKRNDLLTKDKDAFKALYYTEVSCSEFQEESDSIKFDSMMNTYNSIIDENKGKIQTLEAENGQCLEDLRKAGLKNERKAKSRK